MNKLCFFGLLSCLLLSGCIQDSDFEKITSKRIDGWSYLSNTNIEGQTDSASANQIGADQTGVHIHMSFQCVHGSHLQLLISTFKGDGVEPALMKMRYARSAAFGKFRVADLKAENGQSKFTLLADGGTDTNILKINLSSGEDSLKKRLISPVLKLSIPVTPSPQVISIELNNPNIKKVFKDCNFKPAFMMSGLSNL